jgi:hypothetical protein
MYQTKNLWGITKAYIAFLPDVLERIHKLAATQQRTELQQSCTKLS